MPSWGGRHHLGQVTLMWALSPQHVTLGWAPAARMDEKHLDVSSTTWHASPRVGGTQHPWESPSSASPRLPTLASCLHGHHCCWVQRHRAWGATATHRSWPFVPPTSLSHPLTWWISQPLWVTRIPPKLLAKESKADVRHAGVMWHPVPPAPMFLGALLACCAGDIQPHRMCGWETSLVCSPLGTGSPWGRGWELSCSQGNTSPPCPHGIPAH